MRMKCARKYQPVCAKRTSSSVFASQTAQVARVPEHCARPNGHHETFDDQAGAPLKMGDEARGDLAGNETRIEPERVERCGLYCEQVGASKRANRLPTQLSFVHRLHLKSEEHRFGGQSVTRCGSYANGVRESSRCQFRCPRNDNHCGDFVELLVGIQNNRRSNARLNVRRSARRPEVYKEDVAPIQASFSGSAVSNSRKLLAAAD